MIDFDTFFICGKINQKMLTFAPSFDHHQYETNLFQIVQHRADCGHLSP